jgi:hypothetical protein
MDSMIGIADGLSLNRTEANAPRPGCWGNRKGTTRNYVCWENVPLIEPGPFSLVFSHISLSGFGKPMGARYHAKFEFWPERHQGRERYYAMVAHASALSSSQVKCQHLYWNHSHCMFPARYIKQSFPS